MGEQRGISVIGRWEEPLGKHVAIQCHRTRVPGEKLIHEIRVARLPVNPFF